VTPKELKEIIQIITADEAKLIKDYIFAKPKIK